MSEAHYNHRFIEHKWQQTWRESKLYQVDNSSDKPGYYVLDMFPYPSGAGLHVGHPLGYIASDIVSRYKRQNGFNVLHPMGYDAFGLPAEQYAIQTGKHPADTTNENIDRYRKQMDRIGFSFDWSREVRTCDPSYYKWTQWIFKQLFNHWYNATSNKAEHIDNLVAIFENEGNVNVRHEGGEVQNFIAEEWLSYSPSEKEDILQQYRLAFIQETTVNWCEELGTVLANEEVKDGRSERGGYPVIKKAMKQWFLRITAYAQRLLDGLDTIDWSDSIKEIQRNWIGRSQGASVHFPIAKDPDQNSLEIFTTRPDTIFGASFMVVAPEHEWIDRLITDEQREKASAYVEWAKNRSERERMSDVKNVTGAFTGSYCIHPFTGKQIPIWTADYVLGGYGTGAVMAVPAHDSRDHAFAKQFGLDIVQVISNDEANVQEASFDTKEGTCINSDFLNGLSVQQAIHAIIKRIEEKKIGKAQINYKLRDAGFGRQRYWGEPIPVVYKNGLPTLIKDNELPLTLPQVESYKPTGTGESPLAAIDEWVKLEDGVRETDTMPGWAGSSWYFLRYMDPQNDEVLASQDAINYWGQVDFYLGGAEHATGHLLYSRFWNKFLHDIGVLPFDEPFKKLVNQGMIQGESHFIKVYRTLDKSQNIRRVIHSDENKFEPGVFHSFGGEELIIPLEASQHYDLVRVANDDVSNLKSKRLYKYDYDLLSTKELKIYFWTNEISHIEWLVDENGEQYIDLNWFSEKMSKSKHNVVNPDDICEEYGADTLRLYEMFLGPLEDAKPWSISGIDGVYRFLKKTWKLFIDKEGTYVPVSGDADKKSLKTLHATIKKVTEDIGRISLNTCVSTFMIAVNEFTEQKCTNKEVLEQFLILLSPFAPHIAEELWEKGGQTNSIALASWPEFDEKHLVEDSKKYPISINGKTRMMLELSLSLSKDEVEQEVLNNGDVQKWLDGQTPKKVIVVPGRIVNLVV
ncbi:MAG: leucine--tRNA ligase [Bacteroidia bacterium]|nr:leucine--tRNA ligase [Bacteroidia bacterium]